jgi:hypothetical protein
MGGHPMKRVLALAILTALVLGLGELAGRVAVDQNAAGALLSPAGADASAWLIAALYLATRFGGAAMVCLTIGLSAAEATALAMRKLARER